MYHAVLAIDPGTTTGWALVTVPHKGGDIHLDAHGASWWFKAANEIDAILHDYVISEVVAEKFTIAPRTIRGTRSGPEDALGMLGVVRLLAHRVGVPLVLQNPSTAKTAVPDRMIRDELGWLDRLKTPHERDAVRHAIVAHRRVRTWLPAQPDMKLLERH
jgi:hypothetical protein